MARTEDEVRAVRRAAGLLLRGFAPDAGSSRMSDTTIEAPSCPSRTVRLVAWISSTRPSSACSRPRTGGSPKTPAMASSVGLMRLLMFHASLPF